MSPAGDIAHVISAAGIGKFASSVNSEWPVAYTTEPSSPDNAITVYDSGGGEPDTDELDLDTPSVQVRVRSKNYEAAWAKQRAIQELLLVGEFFTADWRYVNVVKTSDFVSLGRDENDRHVLTANYSIMRHKR